MWDFILFILLVPQLLLRTDAIFNRPYFIYKRLYVITQVTIGAIGRSSKTGPPPSYHWVPALTNSSFFIVQKQYFKIRFAFLSHLRDPRNLSCRWYSSCAAIYKFYHSHAETVSLFYRLRMIQQKSTSWYFTSALSLTFAPKWHTVPLSLRCNRQAFAPELHTVTHAIYESSILNQVFAK